MVHRDLALKDHGIGAGTLAATARHAESAVVATMTFDGGIYPFAPAVDTRTGRTFVLSVSGNPRSPHSELRMFDTTTGALRRTLFDATTGRLLRQTPLTQGVPTYGRPPVIDDVANRAYLLLERGAGPGWSGFGAMGPAPATRPTYMIAILDTRTGRLIWTMNLGKSMPSIGSATATAVTALSMR